MIINLEVIQMENKVFSFRLLNSEIGNDRVFVKNKADKVYVFVSLTRR